MKTRTIFAAFASSLLAVVAFLCAIISEILVSGLLVPPNYGWDPVSLWHQSLYGKMLIVLAALAVGVLTLLPILASIFVFLYVYRCISRPTITPPSMQNSL
jgi:hypothetical protein